MNTRLFVGGLPWAAGDQELSEAFASYGTVTDAKVILDRETGKSRGFGFVTFETEAQAKAALEGMNGGEVGGRRVTVKEAQDRGPRRGPGGPGPGGPPRRTGPPRDGDGGGPPRRGPPPGGGPPRGPGGPPPGRGGFEVRDRPPDDDRGRKSRKKRKGGKAAGGRDFDDGGGAGGRDAGKKRKGRARKGGRAEDYEDFSSDDW